jgi:hypothetical protein
MIWEKLYSEPTKFRVFNVLAIKKHLHQNIVERIGIGRVHRRRFQDANPDESWVFLE